MNIKVTKISETLYQSTNIKKLISNKHIIIIKIEIVSVKYHPL